VKIHPSDLILEELLFSSEDENRALQRHLASCSGCRSRLAGLPGDFYKQPRQPRRSGIGSRVPIRFASKAAASGESVDYGPALERSERKYLERMDALQKERADAPALVGELVAAQPEKRNLLVANSPRFQTWGVYELLLEHSWELRRLRRDQAEELARLAIELSICLDPSYYAAELIEDLRARAWSYIANLRRIASDLAGANQAFEVSYAHLMRGSREPLERALFLDLKATLCGAQRKFPQAIRLLNRAITIFRYSGDDHRAGKSMVNLAAVYSYAGQLEEAIPLLRQALALIDPTQDERLVLAAWHNLIDDLAMLGRFIEAQGLYRKARPLYQRNREIDVDLRRLWVKGKIERGLGQTDSAESLFLAARTGFLAEDFPFEAALVSLELAILYAEQERTAELKQLAVEMLPIFASRHIHREAMAALMFLKQAVESERLSLEVVTGIADFLKRAKSDPDLQFKAPV
jgi:tetratricopeptide (TPR) repeat protein